MDLLNLFHKDENTRDAVKAFMIAQLEEMAVHTVFSKKSPDGIYEARELIDKMFNTLSDRYDPPKKQIIESSR